MSDAVIERGARHPQRSESLTGSLTVAVVR
jgi:hypothetical protein